MKRVKEISINIAVILLITLLAACEDWNLKGVKGEGPVVTNDVEISEVQGIVLEIPATVYIEQGHEQSIRIEAQQNIFENIIKTKDDGLLKLYFDKDVSRSEPIKVYMTISSLNGIDVRGAGEVIADERFNTEDNLYINISGSGSVHANADAYEVEMNISGSGDIWLMTNCNKLYSNISGSGDIQLDGRAVSAEFNTSGSGDVDAFSFEVATCKVNVVGSGDAKVNVSESLTVGITGSGDLYYRGNPSLAVNINGSGEIINAN
jgi:hypothetical protein